MAGVKGRSGKKLDTILHDALMMALRLEESDTRRGKTKADRIVMALLEKAEGGDVPAIKEVWDRAEGKVPQALEHTDGDGNPIPPFNVYLTLPK